MPSRSSSPSRPSSPKQNNLPWEYNGLLPPDLMSEFNRRMPPIPPEELARRLQPRQLDFDIGRTNRSSGNPLTELLTATLVQSLATGTLSLLDEYMSRPSVDEQDVARERAARRRAEEQADLERQLRELYSLPTGIQPDKEVTDADVKTARQRAGFIDGCTHIAFCGDRGVGKSSIINALLGMEDDNPQAAKTGETETTDTRGKYIAPKYPGHVLYDMPGAGTANITAWQYYFNQELYIYDLVVIVHHSTLTETDMNTARICTWRKQPFVVVRSKTDLHIWNRARRRRLPDARARHEYLEDARRDGSRESRLGDKTVVLEDHLVCSQALRDVVNEEVQLENALYEPVDEVKLLQKLELLP